MAASSSRVQAVPVTLPATATTLIDREEELAAARATLLRDGIRLLTLTGAPGVGKTRLAVAAAAEVAGAFAGGVVFVDLAPITEPGQVSRVIAQRLGVRLRSAQPALDLLARALREQHLLLVLDGFEHVVDAAADVAVLIAAAPQLKVLVTSREPLRLSWEHQLAVPPLRVPDLRRPLEPAAVAMAPAVMLFLARAQAVDRTFTLTPANAQAVAEICVGLDGLPLALELAAAQVKTLPPEAIRDRLDHRLTLLPDRCPPAGGGAAAVGQRRLRSIPTPRPAPGSCARGRRPAGSGHQAGGAPAARRRSPPRSPPAR